MMEMVTIDSKILQDVIDTQREMIEGQAYIIDYIKKLEEENRHLTIESMVIDNYDLCTYLRTSTRTLLKKRNEGKLAFIDDGGRIRYLMSDVRKFLDNHSFKGCKVDYNHVVECHLSYVKQRNDAKYDQ